MHDQETLKAQAEQQNPGLTGKNQRESPLGVWSTKHQEADRGMARLAVISQQLIQSDWQVADADASRMIDSIRDCSGGANNADLANALHAYGVDVRVVLIDPGHVDLSDIGVGGDVVGG